MSLVTKALPGLFGGVSQQIPAMRHATHCTEQLNGFSTLVDGLYKRPGTKRLAVLPLSGGGGSVATSYGAAFAHVIDRGAAGRFLLLIVNGNLMLYSLDTGAVQTVDRPQGMSYLTTTDPARDIRAVTVADYTFIVNRTRTVAMKVATGTVNPTNVAYINVRTAVPNVAYSAVVNGTSVSISSGATPTNSSVAAALASAIATALPTYTALVVPGTNIVKVVRPSGAIVVTVADGWGNQALQSLTAGVDRYADLPASFEQGYVVRINGSAETVRDPYYVRWDGTRWVETMQPGLQDTLDEATLPFQLRPTTGNSWVFEPVTAWGKRLVGDDNTNPLPSFVGTTIRNVFFFRNRLGFLADDAAVLSRAGSYFNFFSSSATQVLDTDPIDLAATGEDVLSLEWAVPYNETLLLWTAGGQQYVLTAGDILSPKTARLLPSTTFEADPAVSPTSIGSRVLFVAPSGAYSQVNLYRVNEDTVTNMAEDMTEHVPTYVPASPRHLAASTVVKALVVAHGAVARTLSLFKWETDQRDMLTQRAWSTIELGGAETTRVLLTHWVSRRLYLVSHVTSGVDPVVGGRFVVDMLDFDEKAKDTNCDIALRLDARVQVTAGTFDGTNTIIDVPYLAPSTLVAVKAVSGEEPLALTVFSQTPNTVTGTTRLLAAGNHTGAVVHVGSPFTFRYTFTEVFLRDQDGVPVEAASVKLVRYLLRYVRTGWFRALVKPLLRGTYTYPFDGRTIGQFGQGPSQLALSTGTFPIPVHARASGVEVTLESDSYLPCNFPYAEWVGDITMKAQR